MMERPMIGIAGERPSNSRGVLGRHFLSAVSALLFLALFAPQSSALAAGGADAGKPARPMRGDPVAGKAIYNRYCHFCHGRRGYGDGPVGTAITPHPADFVHDAKRMRKSDEKLYQSITEGIQRKIGGEAMAMPRWAGILSEKERWDVLSYVRQLEREGRAREGLEPLKHDGAQDPATR
jgi:mono/diheme cytochrome c family protein